MALLATACSAASPAPTAATPAASAQEVTRGPLDTPPMTSDLHVVGTWKSRHLAGTRTARVLVSPSITSYPRTNAEVGASIVEELSGPGAYLLRMQRLPDGRWAYSAYANGLLIPDPTAGRLCERCHEDAPRDATFGPPAEP